MNHVAVIGAGIAGAAAARRLRRNGVACTLFDKSRGVGGRMATRRANDLRFDHGAQYFTARGSSFAASVRSWVTAGYAAPWFEGGFVGTPAMNAPVKAMVGDADVRTSCHITELQRTTRGWSLHDQSGAVDAPGDGNFTSVILALPAPQAIPITRSAGVAWPELSAVRFDPCWAVMLHFAEHLNAAREHWSVDHGPISWVARNNSKPGRDDAVEAIVAHASPAWSRKHLEATPDEVVAVLSPVIGRIISAERAPDYAVAHRWRFARVGEPAGVPYLWDANARLGACGDWAFGPRVEAAYDSGEAVAGALLSFLRSSQTGSTDDI